MFFSSQRVPSTVEPTGITETLASQRNDPSSRLPSFTPRYMSTVRSAFKYSTVSSMDRRSGSLTISSSGTPARFRSTPEEPSAATPCRLFPASSSMWMRVSRTRRSAPSSVNSTPPPRQMGSSYWLTW